MDSMRGIRKGQVQRGNIDVMKTKHCSVNKNLDDQVNCRQ